MPWFAWVLQRLHGSGAMLLSVDMQLPPTSDSAGCFSPPLFHWMIFAVGFKLGLREVQFGTTPGSRSPFLDVRKRAEAMMHVFGPAVSIPFLSTEDLQKGAPWTENHVHLPKFTQIYEGQELQFGSDLASKSQVTSPSSMDDKLHECPTMPPVSSGKPSSVSRVDAGAQ